MAMTILDSFITCKSKSEVVLEIEVARIAHAICRSKSYRKVFHIDVGINCLSVMQIAK